MRPQKVGISDLSRRGNAWRVRWKVAGRRFERTFTTKAAADRMRRTLFDAHERGERFDVTTGEPHQWGPNQVPTVAEFARTWFESSWHGRASNTRAGYAEAVLEVVTKTLTRSVPENTDVRTWTRQVLCRRPGEPVPDIDVLAVVRGGVHVERYSPPLDAITVEVAQQLWHDIGVRLNGKPKAASTSKRLRDLATKFFDDAVRAGYLAENPMRLIDRMRRRHSTKVDPATVPTPTAAMELIADVRDASTLGARGHTYLLTILLSGCRPSEAQALVPADIQRGRRPGQWGVITFRGGLTQAGKAWTDSGELFDERDVLKWRAEGEVRRVTVPPELIDAIDEHIGAYGLAPDGRIFTNSAGSPISKTLSDAWRPCVVKRFPEPHPFCDLRPYDLRHVHASALIAEGMSPPKIAKRLGHSVTVLLETYAGFFDDEDDAERSRMSKALGL